MNIFPSIHPALSRPWYLDQATGVLQAHFDPPRLYQMVRVQGYHKFRESARRLFREVDLQFTDQELRAMYERLDHHFTVWQLRTGRERP